MIKCLSTMDPRSLSNSAAAVRKRVYRAKQGDRQRAQEQVRRKARESKLGSPEQKERQRKWNRTRTEKEREKKRQTQLLPEKKKGPPPNFQSKFEKPTPLCLGDECLSVGSRFDSSDNHTNYPDPNSGHDHCAENNGSHSGEICHTWEERNSHIDTEAPVAKINAPTFRDVLLSPQLPLEPRQMTNNCTEILAEIRKYSRKSECSRIQKMKPMFIEVWKYNRHNHHPWSDACDKVQVAETDKHRKRRGESSSDNAGSIPKKLIPPRHMVTRPKPEVSFNQAYCSENGNTTTRLQTVKRLDEELHGLVDKNSSRKEKKNPKEERTVEKARIQTKTQTIVR